jgi:hypothetical protein
MKTNFKVMTGLFLLMASMNTFAQANYVQVPQGWSEADKENIYHLDVGTEIMPWRWFFNLELESADSQDKLANHLSSIGLVDDGHGLPIGVTKVVDQRTSGLYKESTWIGVNCTSCHTTSLNVNGKPLLIEGGQSLFNLQKFETQVVKSVQATLNNQEKFERFAEALEATNDEDKESLRDSLSKFQKEFSAANLRSRHFFSKSGEDVDYGPGRLDGIGSATNAFTCALADRLGDVELAKKVVDPKNCSPSNPPASIPHLWGTPQANFSQWNADVHASLARNYGAIMAGYGKNWVVSDAAGKIKFKTTANLINIAKMETYYKKLRSPSWRDLSDKGVVPALDQASVSRGQQVYNNQCISCHAVQPKSTFPNIAGNTYWKVGVTPANIVGTADDYLLSENLRLVNVPKDIANDFKKEMGKDSIRADGLTSGTTFRSYFMSKTMKAYFSDNHTSLFDIAKLNNCRPPSVAQKTLGYKSRSLEGIIWTAPYLHNGSVPTLADLLKPSNERPKAFYIGCANYDAVNGGFNCTKDSENSFLFDTTKEGNRNYGHEYGTTLSAKEKSDLISYIKSLEQPKDPFENSFCN